MDRRTSRAAGDGGRGARTARLAAAGAVFALAAVLAGCATTGPPAEPLAPPAAVALGPVITLLDVPPTTDRVRAVPAKDGSVHVLVASNGARVVREIVVAPSGAVVQRRIVATDVAASHLDAAFDRQGRLHTVVDDDHFVYEQDAWRKADRTPWEGLDVKSSTAHFVANAPDLVWVLSVPGREIGASGRWEIYGFGGYAAGIIWPWFTRGSRAVIVADTPEGFGPWIVIDPEGQMDTSVTDATADDAGNVYLAYRATREGMLPAASLHYLKLDAEVLAGRDGVEWQRPGVRASLHRLRAARGTPLAEEVAARGESAYRPNFVPHPPHFFGGAVASGFRLSTNVSQRPRALVVAEAHDKWLGRGFPMQYVEFDDFRWSLPIEVGLADHAGGVFAGYIWHAFDLATTNGGRTFVVWPTTQGIVGRWIDGKR